MGKGKLQKIAETKEMKNLLEFPKHCKGKWKEEFGNDNPIVLELACGKGHYTLGLAGKYPGINVIGIDIKGTRLWAGAGEALKSGMENIRFCRFMIEEIDEYFEPNEVSEIWITFPDPQPKKERKRLFYPDFLDAYKGILKEDGIVHLKTDNSLFFEYSLGVLAGLGISTIRQTRHLYHSDLYEDPLLQIKTYYEQLWSEKGSRIKYLSFKFNNKSIPLSKKRIQRKA